ncbi:MAG: DEAD/DEAH box helicase [Deltaproteobacteria bacterium]|nr:DEAD/DEAH box helicase [Deltaproteobacteria bacterium]
MSEQNEEALDLAWSDPAQRGIPEPILAGMRDLGYARLLPVQAACLEPLREGSHLSVRSKTGTGKTAAFGIPLLERIELGADGPAVLILAPTRELAAQIGTELAALGRHCGLRLVAAYGGMPIGPQVRELRRGVDFVVGTPGRLLDLARQGELALDRILCCVLDEADEMLSMGFYEDVTGLMDQCQRCEQVVMLSASLSEETDRLIARYAPEVVRIDLSVDRLSVEGIRNVYYKIGDDLPRHHYLLHVMAAEQPESAIVFVNTRTDASLVTTQMAREGLRAEMLSGDLPQSERERVMAAIRSGELRFLVATDLAARGIDISDLSHVINFSLPEDPAVFLHRVGRTGRVGKTGTSISLVSGRHLRTLGVLERQFGVRLEQREFPPASEMTASRTQSRIAELAREAGAAICDGYLDQARAVVGHADAVQIVAYLLKQQADLRHDAQRPAANRPARRPGRREGGGRPKGGKPRGGKPRRPRRRR